MNWKQNYQKKLRTAAEALGCIQSGARVLLGHNCAEPRYLVQELINQAPRLKNVEVMHILSLNKCLYAMPEYQKSFRHHTLTYLSPAVRAAKREDFVEYTPIHFSQAPELIRGIEGGVQAALIQLSPPDEKGLCSFGVSCDYTKGGAECAEIVIAQINKNMPRVLGDNFIHIDDIDYIVEQDEDLPDLVPAEASEVDRQIAAHCASLIPDGATLQLGVGSLPDAVAGFLTQKNDLGIHSEMISDRVMELILSGNVNNSRKTLHRGKCVVSFLMGSRQFYDFIHNNDIIEMHPVNYTNDVRVIAQNYRPVSINSALQIDLTGQINAESIGPLQYTGTGGQLDFVRGTALAKDGISIIALPSTARKGALSRIAPFLDKGSIVTTPRCDTDYVITEHGIAHLKNKTLRQRTEALIAIAAPQFRDELKKSLRKI